MTTHDIIILLAFFIGDIIGIAIGLYLMLFFVCEGLPFLRNLWRGVRTWMKRD